MTAIISHSREVEGFLRHNRVVTIRLELPQPSVHEIEFDDTFEVADTAIFAWMSMFWIRYRCVAVTRDATYELDSYKPSAGAKPRPIVGTLSRHTQLGPVSGRWGQLTLAR